MNIGNALTRKSLTFDRFKRDLELKMPNIKIVGEFYNYKTRITVMDKNGILYNAIPSELIRGSIPSIKIAQNPNYAFSILAKSIHGDRYTYEDVDYFDTRKKVSINCKLHGPFLQKPVDHMRGSGCPLCGLARTIENLTTNHIGWNLKKWKDCGLRNNGNPFVYIIKIYDNDECFIKIGKTYKGIKNRFRCNSKSLPYNFEVIKTIDGDYDETYHRELELNKKYKNYKYMPKKKFHGFNECFMIDIINLI